MREDQLGSIEKMRAQCPPYPTELVEGLGLNPKDAGKLVWGAPYFTGWKGLIGGVSPEFYLQHEIGDFPEVDLADIGYCAQWIFWFPGEPMNRFAYVNLPGMQCGTGYEGGVFEVGNQRVRANTPPEDIDTMILSGHEKLMDLVKRETEHPARLRHGSCCPHTAEDHIWLVRNGEIYSTACKQCGCCFWKETAD